ncbi:hypothetical protein F0562_014776 [Nyssa sinensis]|uniref:Uncharacterized protein n=1 Tax=Nyssa sinensis TaxID=561372 RepID=A0A5J4ZPU8_9ASTE|nr:hypothetical protein F0562_014776 [Nyssa sinensis]
MQDLRKSTTDINVSLRNILFLLQVVAASFLPNSHHELKPKKQKTESKVAATTPGSAATLHTSNVEKEGFNAQKQQNSAAQKPDFAPPSSLTDKWATIQTMQDLRKSTTDITVSLQGEKSIGPEQVPYFEVPQSWSCSFDCNFMTINERRMK